ncbi:cyclic nucleotide-binding domain-containing protein 2-like isoform X2 [Anneissia japonica]|uniref:cyclic nucleotide-binding domain-containing protein 2-like isoform X2 n=1 Tax=Anneissia japonica TaxID=1529436 RepID=UPI001425830C|nr:cyclic nucleotide-binding domain-containing protein 2-like isoform X2 [Anneissia japonica]
MSGRIKNSNSKDSLHDLSHDRLKHRRSAAVWIPHDEAKKKLGGSSKGLRRRTTSSLLEGKREPSPRDGIYLTPYQRFRRKANAVRWLCKVCICVMKAASENALKGSLLEVIEDVVLSAEEEARRTGNSGLLQKGIVSSAYPDMRFDASEFQRFSKREEGIPKKIKELLKLQPEDRTTEQIDNIVRNMQNVEEFAKYPPEIQCKMSEFAWYDKFGRNRVVIKEGYVAEGLYIVLSGELTETFGGQTYILKKGDKFGESDIIRNCRRTNTVMTKDTVELFCIHSEDYMEIFDTKLNITPGDVMNYVRTIPVFSMWSGIGKMVDSLLNWGIQNYRAGQVIVSDSENNDWIYIVKSGKCDVLKRLTPGVCSLDESRTFYKQYKKSQNALEIKQIHEQSSLKVNLQTGSKDAFITVPSTCSPSRAGTEVTNTIIKCNSSPQQTALNNSSTCIITEYTKKGCGLNVPFCVRVAELEAGDVFGLLSTIPGSKEPKVSLVSQGAEAIRINKQFFLKFADERVFTQIEMRYEAYPSQDDCLSVLDMTNKWQRCKSNELSKTVDEVHNRIQARKDSRR